MLASQRCISRNEICVVTQRTSKVMWEEFALNFADSLPDTVFLVDQVGVIQYVNAACIETFGYRPTEIIGHCVMDLVVSFDRRRTEREAAKVLSGQKRVGFENRYRHKDGSEICVSWSARWMEQQHLRIGVARDVTPSKSAPVSIGELVVSHALLERLAPYERKVLQLLLTDASEKQIAEQLGLAVSTTHSYITGIFRKLNVRGRAGLMSLCMRHLVHI